MTHTDFNYAALRPLDVLCTSASTLTGRLIRLATARLKNRSPLVEASRQVIANHCAIVIQLDVKYWIAEMVDDGLKINSLRTYLNNPKEQIVAVKRHKLLTCPNERHFLNWHLVELCQKTVDYDYKMFLQYFGRGQNDKSKYYCSELVEVLANRVGTTWDHFQLKRPAPDNLIAPVEIQFGAPEYSDFVSNIYID